MLAFFKSRQNNGTTPFASVQHSKAIKGPKDFKLNLFIENFMSISKMWSKIVFNLSVPVKQLLKVKKKFLKSTRMVLLNPLELFFCQVLG
jgi:hypothetical protein